MNINKAKLIMPLIVLSSAAISVIIMFVRQFEFNRMLWTLFIVLIIFYVIGDVVQYIYERIRPRIIPEADDIERLLSKVDMSKLQLDDEILQQYLEAGAEDGEELDPDLIANAAKLDFDNAALFGDQDAVGYQEPDYQDDVFMDETQGNY